MKKETNNMFNIGWILKVKQNLLIAILAIFLIALIQFCSNDDDCPSGRSRANEEGSCSASESLCETDCLLEASDQEACKKKCKEEEETCMENVCK